MAGNERPRDHARARRSGGSGCPRGTVWVKNNAPRAILSGRLPTPEPEDSAPRDELRLYASSRTTQTSDLNFAFPPSDILDCPLTSHTHISTPLPSRLLRRLLVDLNRGAFTALGTRQKKQCSNAFATCSILSQVASRRTLSLRGRYQQQLFWACTVTVAGRRGKLKSSWPTPPGDSSAQAQATAALRLSIAPEATATRVPLKPPARST